MSTSVENEAGNAAGNERRQYQYLSGYADFLIKNHLEEFARLLLKFSREEDIPLLRFFQHYSEEEFDELNRQGTLEFLSAIRDNKINGLIRKSNEEWINNQLPIIEREQVLADDITLVSLVRRKAFRYILPEYTTDLTLFSNIMEDVDRVVIAFEAANFEAYIKIQQAALNMINQELEQRHAELLEAQALAEMGSFFWDMKNNRSTFTPGVAEILDTKGAGGFDHFLDRVHPKDKQLVMEAMERAINNEGLFECEYRYLLKGEEKRIWSRGIIYFENGVPTGMKGTVMDVTRERELLEKLQESEELHKQAQALTHIGNWSWEPGSGEIQWSDELYRIWGLEPQSEKITFERFLSLIHPEDRENRIREINETLATGISKDYVLRVVNPDGQIRILKGKGDVILDENKKPVKLVGTCQDFTKEHLLNTQLREKENNLQLLINNAPDAVVVVAENNTIQLWNPKAEELFGWKIEEVTGRNLSETILPEGSLSDSAVNFSQLIKNNAHPGLKKSIGLTAIQKSGKEFFISLTVSETIQGGKPAYIAFIRDISKEKEVLKEIEDKSIQLQQQNVELERINKELESFNYIASHDLQEPLRKIQTFSDRILSKYEEEIPDEVRNDFERIRLSSARMQKLIEDLLTFSQSTLSSENAVPVDLNAVIQDVNLSFISAIEEKNIRIDRDELPVVHVVPFQITQVFTNLIGNAIKYQKADVPLRIKIHSTVISGHEIPLPEAVEQKSYLRISVSDNGIGFDQTYAGKIFDLFTRLHSREKYSGTGIGLAICKKILHKHQGFIDAESVKDEGSVFHVYLPSECLVENKVRQVNGMV